jgi:hypothetical protein
MHRKSTLALAIISSSYIVIYLKRFIPSLLFLDEDMGSLHFLFTVFSFFSQLCLGAFKIQANCLLDKYADSFPLVIQIFKT